MTVHQVHAAFHHEALFYSGDAGFLEGTVPFVREGLAAGEAVMVMIGGERIELLRGALDDSADSVSFVDMHEVGRNPARIIPAWRDFVDQCASEGRAARGIGEPIWPGRSAAELVECTQHECLLNLAFADASDMRLLCPYDVDGLEAGVIDAARANHPWVTDEEGLLASATYSGADHIVDPLTEPRPDPPPDAEVLPFDALSLRLVRQLALRQAAIAELPSEASERLVLAVSELGSNSVRHGGGGGVIRIWQESDAIVCEVADRGQILERLVGRGLPSVTQTGGLGLWMVNQLCDLVQVRTYPSGTLVRVRVGRGG
jgi:anti-sigma regulatory factor (Ser/Thr protein kinase)